MILLDFLAIADENNKSYNDACVKWFSRSDFVEVSAVDLKQLKNQAPRNYIYDPNLY